MGENSEGSDWGTEAMEKELQSMIRDGVLADLVEVDKCNLKNPRSVAPFNHLPFKLFESATFTRVLTAVLDHTNPGTEATYNEILAAIMRQTHTDSFCYVHGGQVRDLLTGKISKDVDINYACTAKDVAMICVENEWPIKYIAIGTGGRPNYVLIGDEPSGLYMEGFSLSFNISDPRLKQDFRRNMVAYDFANHVIIDKTGFGLADIRNNELRFACAPSKDMWEDWALAEATAGEKALRYVKFVMRGLLRHKPLTIDTEESAFVAVLLKKAFRENKEPLQAYWFGYLLGECLSKQEGVSALYSWVCEHGGDSWWEDWLPFVKPIVAVASWLDPFMRTPRNGKADMREAKKVFTRYSGDGLIEAEDLEYVLRSLNLNFTEAEFEMLTRTEASSAAAESKKGVLNIDTFLDSLTEGGKAGD